MSQLAIPGYGWLPRVHNSHINTPNDHWNINKRRLEVCIVKPNGQFKLGTFFVSSIILQPKHELTSQAASMSILMRLLQVRPAIIAKDVKKYSFGPSFLCFKNNKDSDALSKRHQQLQRGHTASANYFRSGRCISFRWRWQQKSHAELRH